MTIVVDRTVLIRYGDDMWSSDGTSRGHIVLRRTASLYQADVGNGTAAWHDSPELAVAAARRDAQNAFDRRTMRAIVRNGDFL